MSTSPIIMLLAERPLTELERELERLTEAYVRVGVEIGYYRAAISLKSRQRAARPARRRAAPSRARGTKAPDGPTTRERVVKLLRERGGAYSPADINNELAKSGYSGSRSAIHNSLMKLVRDGDVQKVGEGLYRVAAQQAPEQPALKIGQDEPPSRVASVR